MSTIEAQAATPRSGQLGRPPFRASLRLKLASFVAALVILTAGLVIGGVYSYTRQILLDGITDHLAVMASDRAAIVREFINRQLGQVDQIASRTRLRLLIAEHANQAPRDRFEIEVRQILNDALEVNDSQLALSIYSPQGRLIVSTSPEEPPEIPPSSDPLAKGLVESQFGDFLPAANRLLTTVSSPLVTRDGTVIGVLIARIDASPLLHVLKNLIGLRETGEILIAVEQAGKIHYLLPDRQGRPVPDADPPRDPPMALALDGKTGIIKCNDPSGKPLLAAHQPLGYHSWGLIARIDEDEAYAPLQRLQKLLFALEGGLLLFGSLASYILARQLTRPLTQLADSAAKVAAGNLEVRVPVASQDELGILASAFNHMTEKLAASYGNLEQNVRARTNALQLSQQALSSQTRLLQSMLDGLADGVVATGPSGEFLIFNPAAQRMVGTGATDKNPGQWQSHYGLFHPDRTTPYQEDELPLVRAMRGDAVDNLEVFIRNQAHPDGVLISVNARPLLDDQGNPHGGIVVFRDISASRLAEETLKRTANELAQSNDQLQRFTEDLVKLAAAERQSRLELEQANKDLKRAEAHLVQSEKLTSLGLMVAGVAHEINNPLAFVSNNLAVIQRDVGLLNKVLDLFHKAEPTLAQHDPTLLTQLTELADDIDLPYTQQSLQTLFERSREGLRRIENIVRDLRDFARVDPGDYQEVDLNPGLRSSLNIIQGRARNQGVTLVTELEPLPLVPCQPGKINQVILNLLVNALDACKNGGTITIRSHPEPDNAMVRLEIEDTGTGIPADILDRIFDPFFTTKPLGMGTGLGLSISYGIVASHGGSLEVESEPGRGSHFIIRLPLKRPSPEPSYSTPSLPTAVPVQQHPKLPDEPPPLL